MQSLYERLERWDIETKKNLWKEWFWGSDCNVPPLEQCCDMNKTHVLGILCALGESVDPVAEYGQNMVQLLPNIPSLHLNQFKPVCEWSLRELLDQLECMQLNWGQVLSGCSLQTSFNILRACMARLGHIAHHAYPLTSLILNDPQYITTLSPENNLCVISRKTLRQTICIFLALFRVHDIVVRAIEVPKISEEELKGVVGCLKQHHMEASMDLFNLLQQMVHLAPGMRLVYRTNFAGMYNDVSQVIYFHYPRFCRQPQTSLKEISSMSMHYMLPLVTELFPDIPIFYEDDSSIPGITTLLSCSTQKSEWIWLVCCGAVFLVKVNEGIIYTSEQGLSGLLAFFLKMTGRAITSVEEDTTSFQHDINTPYGHLQLL